MHRQTKICFSFVFENQLSVSFCLVMSYIDVLCVCLSLINEGFFNVAGFSLSQTGLFLCVTERFEAFALKLMHSNTQRRTWT